MTPTSPARPDAGTISLSTSIVVPTILMLLVLAMMAGRLSDTHGAVESAANEAARAASLSRTVADGQAAVQATTGLVLTTSDGLDCTGAQVSSDLAALGAPAGQLGQVSVTVTCTVPLANLGPFGDADHTITYTATSVVDPYRSRR